MADVYTYVLETGLIVPDTGTVLQEGVVAEYQSVFGMDLVTTPNTPQGVLIVAETAARVAVADNNAALANQINPNVAGGVYLDAIGQLTGSFRSPATPSSVTATLTGTNGVIIPMGSQASDSVYGNVFQTTVDVTIVGGTASVLMQSVENGPIVAGSGTLTIIVTPILGWTNITNSESATLGNTTESDEQFRFERRNTLAAQGASTAGAIISALYLVPGVTSLTFLENIAATTQTIQGVTMVSHSIYACIAGTATPLAIATAMQSKKSAGAAYNNGASGGGGTPAGNNISQAVVVPYSNQTITVLYDTPDMISISVLITISLNQPLPDPVNTVKAAIVNYAKGLVNGLAGLVVGANVSPWEIASAVTLQYPEVFVSDLQIKITGGSYAYLEIAIDIFEQAFITTDTITVVGP